MMVGVKKTKKKTTINNNSSDTRLFVSQLVNARVKIMDWINKDEIHWSKYQIKETDMRVKTATFTSQNYFDLTTGTYCVLITSPQHEDFGGVILSVEKDVDTGLYNYQCQDFTRFYQEKCEIVIENVKLHRLLTHLITGQSLPLTGDITKAKKSWKKELSGLRPAWQYDQKSWGSKKNFNPMTKSLKAIIKGKSLIETVRDYCFGSGAFLDVYTDKYGVLHVSPYHKKDWLSGGVTIPFESISDMKIKFDTTNIITGVNVQSSEQLKVGHGYTSKDLVGLDLAAIFGNNGASISNPNQNKTSSSKKSSTTKNTNNPYNTKKKIAYISSDNIKNKSVDTKFINDIAKLLRKNGWSTKIIGVGPGTHTEPHMNGCKNGVWFCIYGGIDAAVLRETVRKNSYTNKLKKLNSRTVIGMRTGIVKGKPCDIRKGGKCYKWLPRARDDNYSEASFRGVNYPLKMLTDGKVPIMYASSAEKMVAKFLKGGDNPTAC